jgi:hypothetical protein
MHNVIKETQCADVVWPDLSFSGLYGSSWNWYSRGCFDGHRSVVSLLFVKHTRVSASTKMPESLVKFGEYVEIL